MAEPIQFEAIYEGGVLRPIDAVPLSERQRVQLTVSGGPIELDDLLDWEYIEECRIAASDAPSLEQVRELARTIPESFADAIRANRELR